MRISEAFPSRYLRAADVKVATVCTIRGVVMEQLMDGKSKPVIYFNNAQKGLVLNKTNASRIADVLGDDTSSWLGKEVMLDVETVPFRGEAVPAIRVRVGRGAGVSPLSPQVQIREAQKPLDEQLGDDIPFAWVGALIMPWFALLGSVVV
jgi:hypothetical protein